MTSSNWMKVEAASSEPYYVHDLKPLEVKEEADSTVENSGTPTGAAPGRSPEVLKDHDEAMQVVHMVQER